MNILHSLKNWIRDTTKLYNDGVRAGRSFGSIALTATGRKGSDGEFLVEINKSRTYLAGFKHGLKLRTGTQPLVRHVSGHTFGLTT